MISTGSTNELTMMTLQYRINTIGLYVNMKTVFLYYILTFTVLGLCSFKLQKKLVKTKTFHHNNIETEGLIISISKYITKTTQRLCPKSLIHIILPYSPYPRPPPLVFILRMHNIPCLKGMITQMVVFLYGYITGMCRKLYHETFRGLSCEQN